MGKNRKSLGRLDLPSEERGARRPQRRRHRHPSLKCWWMPLEKFPSRTASICPRARFRPAGLRFVWTPSNWRTQLLTGLHHIEKGSEISDPRILRYLPAEASDIHLISDRNGHMAHYRISPKAFDAFLKQVWKRYREERAAKPESWLDYSEEEIAEALKGASVGRYEPQVRSTDGRRSP